MARLENTSLISDANLVAYYKLENVNDSKNSFHLTNNNSVAFSAGKYDNAADGGAANADKFLNIASNLGIAGNSSFSASLWIKMNTEIASGTQVFFQHLSTLTVDRYINCYYDYNAGTRRIVCAFSSGNATFNIAIGTSAFVHVVIVRDVDAGTGIIYVNNVASSSVALGTSTTGISRVNILGAAADSFLSGLVDDVAIFSRALNSTEVGLLFSQSSNSPSASRSSSASQSPSASTSPSFSASASESKSESKSESASPSLSGSPSASVSSSLSPSSSSSASQSPSASLSPSSSPSASGSASGSASESKSQSRSLSPSASLSPSSSVSASPSPASYINNYSTVGNTYTDKYTSTY